MHPDPLANEPGSAAPANAHESPKTGEKKRSEVPGVESH